ncbi:hypothetical protein [Flavobacterium sp. I3-2]|uniref:hypothetical protein n=1 Tax=Flavobacterium sp. I3-2 TaxID=2748319 RepID=UPI0015B1363B|nr:hypothetical protein [Flavobacterium sp. I3-2]
MKKFILLLFVSINAFAQEKYEAFQYENKFGIVNKENLEEYLEPKFEEYAPIFTDVLAFVNKDIFYFFNKETGESISYKTKDEYLYLKNRSKYFHFLEDNKSLLISSTVFADKFLLEKEYNNFENSSDYIIAYSDDNKIDVFDKDNMRLKIRDIPAKRYMEQKILDTNTQIEFYVNVFFGMETVLFYDEDYNLLKEIETKVPDRFEAFSLIKKHFTIVESNLERGAGGRAEIIRWESNKVKDKTAFTFGHLGFEIAGSYEEILFPINSIYKDSKSLNYWVVLNNKETKNLHAFKIDYKNNAFIYPKKYLKKLKLKMKKL